MIFLSYIKQRRNEMDQNLQNLYHQKELLKEKIKIAEIGNDSYDLSFECRINEVALWRLNQQIKQLEKEVNLSPEQNF